MNNVTVIEVVCLSRRELPGDAAGGEPGVREREREREREGGRERG